MQTISPRFAATQRPGLWLAVAYCRKQLRCRGSALPRMFHTSSHIFGPMPTNLIDKVGPPFHLRLHACQQSR
jgi:hypothetical protein